MIDRLTSGIRRLVVMSAAELASDSAAVERDDCADAVRLELDCPQQSLTPSQRAALSRLSDALEGGASPNELFDTVRGASRALALAPRA